MTISRSFRNATLIATAAVAALALGAPALTASPQDTVKLRQANYKKMGAAFKALNEQLKSDAPAKDVVLVNAKTLAAIAPGQGKLFPAGTGPGAGIETDALPGIWTDRGTFDAQMTKMVTEANKLAAVAGGGDMTAIRAQAKATGATCGACHRQFRADT